MEYLVLRRKYVHGVGKRKSSISIKKSSPFQEGYYIPIEVTSENDKEYVCKHGTINKKSMLYNNGGRNKLKTYTEQEKNEDVYITENRYVISQKIMKASAEVLRKVEEILNN